jgi:hypothetical protein
LERRQPSPTARVLVERLTAEWKDTNSTASQPIILEERNGSDRPVHVFVVWDEWADLGGVERSEVVMEAFEQRYGRDEALNVTVAMGLTPAEAERLNIPYK